MPVEKVEMFRTTNGEIFATEEEATKHQFYLDLTDFLSSSDIYWRDASAADVATFLTDNAKEVIKMLSKIKE